jgi:hypothetical protein
LTDAQGTGKVGSDRPDADAASDSEAPQRRPRQAGFIVWPLAILIVLWGALWVTGLCFKSGFRTFRKSRECDVPLVVFPPPIAVKFSDPISANASFSNPMSMLETCEYFDLKRSVIVVGDRYGEVYRYWAVRRKNDILKLLLVLGERYISRELYRKFCRIKYVRPDSQFPIVRRFRASPIRQFDPLIVGQFCLLPEREPLEQCKGCDCDRPYRLQGKPNGPPAVTGLIVIVVFYVWTWSFAYISWRLLNEGRRSAGLCVLGVGGLGSLLILMSLAP